MDSKLNRDRYNAYAHAHRLHLTGEEEVPLGGLFPLLQAGVEKAQELQDPLLSARLGQAGVVHHQVGVDLAIMAADVETPCCRVVFLNNFHSGHEPRGEGRETGVE